MSLRRLALALILAAACSGGSTSALVELSGNLKTATGVYVHVIGTSGELAPRTRLPEGSAKLVLPGTVVVQLSDGVGKIKVVAIAENAAHDSVGWGFTDAWVAVPSGQQTKISISLSGAPFADNDVDDVPDKIDNCPADRNPEQTDKDGNGKGDACDGKDAGGDRPGDGGPGDAGDGGVKDGAADVAGDGTPCDSKPPMAWAGTCDPVKQDCTTGKKCDWGCPANAFGCVSDPGGGDHGDDCTSGPCKAGNVCVSPGKCRRYCNADCDCPAGKTCDLSTGLVCPDGGASPMGRLCNL